MAAKLCEHGFHRLQDPVVRVLESIEALLHDLRQAGALVRVDDALVVAAEGPEPELEPRERRLRVDGVVVAPVARAADAGDEAELLEPTRVGADAGLADAEPGREVVEGTGLGLDDEVAEDASGDPREAFIFPEEPHRLDEVDAWIAGAHGGEG